ncbi:MAG: hypothetical protein ACFFC6_15575, partial [Promethearchaeota archaeon]
TLNAASFSTSSFLRSSEGNLSLNSFYFAGKIKTRRCKNEKQGKGDKMERENSFKNCTYGACYPCGSVDIHPWYPVCIGWRPTLVH